MVHEPWCSAPRETFRSRGELEIAPAVSVVKVRRAELLIGARPTAVNSLGLGRGWESVFRRGARGGNAVVGAGNSQRFEAIALHRIKASRTRRLPHADVFTWCAQRRRDALNG